MINSMLWCHLALAKMYGLIFIVCGDFNQFGPICDSFAGCQVPEDKLEHSQLLLDLVGGNRLRLYTNRRSDQALFDFYTSIFLSEENFLAYEVATNGFDLESKLEEARRLFPVTERDADTALCISHKQRMNICGKMNKKNIPKDSIFLRAPKNANYRNAPQDMFLWKGLRVFGAVTANGIMRGCLYKIEEAVEDGIKLKDGPTLSLEQACRCLRLAYAITYASSQGLTLPGVVRLHTEGQFTLKHLYVGSSRCTSSQLLEVA